MGVDVSAELLDAMSGDVDAPQLLDVEVMSALRGLSLGGRIGVPGALDVPLYTCDAKLATKGAGADVIVMPRSA